MKTQLENKPPKWFWIVAVLALLWNLIGVMAYISDAFMTEEMKASLAPEHITFINNTPPWVTAAYAMAVFAGTLGCIGLLVRKKWALFVFWVSLVAVLVQNIYGFIVLDAMAIFGVSAILLPIMVIVIGVLLILFSKKSISKGWLS